MYFFNKKTIVSLYAIRYYGRKRYDDAKIQRTQVKVVPIFCLSTSHIFLSILIKSLARSAF